MRVSGTRLSVGTRLLASAPRRARTRLSRLARRATRALCVAFALCVTLALSVALLALAPVAGAQAPVQPYATTDAGGFRNVLPAGENGLDNAQQRAEFEASKEKGEEAKYPPHFADQ